MLYIYLPIFVTFLIIIKKKYNIYVFDQVLWPKEIIWCDQLMWPREIIWDDENNLNNYDCEKNNKLD